MIKGPCVPRWKDDAASGVLLGLGTKDTSNGSNDNESYYTTATSGFKIGPSSILGRGAARAEDPQGTHTQSHISPSILVYDVYPLDCSAESDYGRAMVGSN